MTGALLTIVALAVGQTPPVGLEGLRDRLQHLSGVREGEFRLEAPLRQLSIESEETLVLAAAGGIRAASRGLTDQLTLRAESIVVWLDRKRLEQARKSRGQEQEKKEEEKDLFSDAVQGLYAEGTVMALLGLDEEVRCDQLYYEPASGRALFLNGYLHTSVTARGQTVPLYVRAAELRRTAPGVLRASNARVSSCEFGRPHTHVRAGELRTWADVESAPGEPGVPGQTRVVEMRNLTFEVRSVPLFYWPRVAAAGEGNYFPLRRVRTGHSSHFGTQLLTEWGDEILLPDAQGKDQPWGRWLLDLDYRSERGFAGGPGLRYETDDYFGKIDTYFMHDSGETDVNDVPITERDRGRARVQHRHWLRFGDLGEVGERIGDVQLDVEAAWISDRNFLNEYYEHEFKEDKAQETYGRLKKQWDNQALTLTAKYRINRFFTETDELPNASYHLLNQPVFPEPVAGTNLLISNDTQWGQVRLNPDEALNIDALNANRFDTDTTGAVPFKAGIFRFLPEASGRYSFWSNALDDGDEIDRAAFAGGLRGATQLARVYPKALAGVLPIRHVMNPSLGWRSIYSVNTQPGELIPFDAVESLREFEVVTIGLRNRLQTKLGDGILDFMDLNLTQPFFPEDARDNAGRNWGNLLIDFKGAPRRDVFLLAEAEWDHYDGDFAIANLGVMGAPTSKLVLFASDRMAKGLAHVITVNADYRLNEKWSAFVLAQYNVFDQGGSDYRLAVRRRFHRWIGEFYIDYDRARSDVSVGVAISPVELYRGFHQVLGASDRPRLGITPSY